MNQVIKNLWKVLTLDADLYAIANQDKTTIQLAKMVPLLAAISHTLGSTIILLVFRSSLTTLLFGLLINGLAVFGGYYWWSFTIWKSGQLLKLPVSDYQNWLSLVGWAYTPQLLNFFTVVPLLGRPVEIGLAIWSLLAVIIAIDRQLHISPWKGISICIVGWLSAQVGIGVVQLLIQRLLD